MSSRGGYGLGSCAAVLLFVLSVGGALGGDEVWAPVLVLSPSSRDDICRNAIVMSRARTWRQQGPLMPTPFSDLGQIVESVVPTEIRRLEGEGCNPAFMWGFAACTQLDDPSTASHIIPAGKSAETDAEMAEIMAACLKELDAQGIAASQ